MMKPERWQEIDRVFAEALEREPEERASFLDGACGDDTELRREVESLLAHDLPNTIPGDKVWEEATQLLTAHGTRTDIGPYRVIRSLGAGGMGHVYLAHDSRLNRPVAVKLISHYIAGEEESVRRFRQEALAASALNHPNILTIYEIGEVDGDSFIATEFVDGKTLRELIDSAPIPIDRCLDIAKQIATALSAAHAAGIVHRDIKPPNIMIRFDGLVKILDFGVAKFTLPNNEGLSDPAIETTPGTVVGTAAYMSPEQARGNPIDNRSDLWSLGVILYEMVTGQRPFEGDTALDLMSAVIERQPAPLSSSGKVVPSLLEDLVFKALEKNREHRYQTATEVLLDLQELTKSLEIAQTIDRLPGQSKAVTHRSSRTSAEASIAVLPFVNMSADSDNEYFCDGLSEELLNALSRINDLKVAARTSAFSFKGKDTTVSEIGRALNVNTALEGSVRRSGTRLRIMVQLVNCADGYHLWSERYDREMQDIFDVQDEITLAIVAALKVKLLGKEKDAILKRYTDNVEAYQLYLKGRYYWWKTDPEEYRKSRDFFERAVAADPSYALSYAGISSYFGYGSAWGMVPPDIGWVKACEANDRSLALDNTLAEVHTNTGGINMVYRRDLNAAEQNIKRSIELNPGFQEAHYIYSSYLAIRGRFDEAIAEAQEALDLDPFSLRLNHHLGHTYYLARRYDDAITQYHQAIELDANNPQLHESLGDAYEQKGKYNEAITEWQIAMKLEGDSDGADTLGRVHTENGFKSAVQAMAQPRAEQLEKRRELGEYLPAIHFARVHTRLGNTEKAFEWLTKACEERNVFALLIHADPLYDSLRSDERLTALMQSFNLPNEGSITLNTESRRSEQTSGGKSIQTASDTSGSGKRLLTKTSLSILAGLMLIIVSTLVYWIYSKRLSPIGSIAVLPFKNETSNADLEYLAEGMPETLINSLSQLPHLSVKSRSSVFRYKGRDIDPQKIASELSVQAVLEGRVVQHGDDLTISLSLVDGSNGNQIWGQQYDRKLSQLVTLQNEIVRDVSQKLRVQLSGDQQQKLTKDYTANAEAYQLYLKGRFHVFKLTPAEVEQGISDFQQAIDLDPNYALAYVGLSEANRSLTLGGERNPIEYLFRAKAAAEKALMLDESLPEAHTALAATLFWYDRNWSEAENHFKRALELNPKTTDAHLFYAHLMSNLGRHDEALFEIKRARELDPTSPFASALEGQFLVHAGHADEALVRLKEASALAPGFWFPHVFASSAYIEKGMYVEAIAEARRASELSSAQTVSLVYEGVALAKWGKTDEAQAVLDRLLQISQQKDRWMPPSHIAMMYSALGKTDETIAWLQKGIEQHDPKIAFIKVQPVFNNLRNDPRFQDVMRRAGF